ncbi:unnamed protein product [Clonostachys solani]|uniref:Major facilitator superfamily (MFS) profile domain-containing protein n=1 Tax=Clonostachys solani TaxID=160281 RepID=A0A9N9ZKV4_9HYPO|nr:unnamed protein product [Clonostachys solani]
MLQFHAVFPQTETAFGASLMTGMLLLGAFNGCIFMPYVADKISRKWALTLVVVIFNIGAILQTAAVNYTMLVVGRTIGGIGVGTLVMTMGKTLEQMDEIFGDTSGQEEQDIMRRAVRAAEMTHRQQV